MRDDCIRAVTQAAAAAGRTLTSADLRGIEGHIKQALRDNAREDRAAFQRQTPQQQLQEAADRVAKDIVAEKQRAVRNTALQVVAHDRAQRFVDDLAGKGMRRIEAVRRLFTNWLDNKAGVRSIEQNREGIARIYKGALEPIAKATQKYLGFWTDRAMVRDVVRELYGEDTGNATAKDVGTLWSDRIAEPLRQQFNEVGGAVRQLKGWAVPQDHSLYKVAKAPTGAWIDYVLPRLRRDAYVNTDGSLMSDAQMRALLGEAKLSIETDGAWNETQAPGGSAIRNRGQDRRVLHFKDADSYLDYQAQFGERSLLETMNGHIDGMARNIAALQTFGPNAEAGLGALLTDAKNRDAAAGIGAAVLKKQESLAQTEFKLASGTLGSSGDPRVAHAFQVMRSTLAAAKLGSAALSAVTDSANIIAVARAWNLPEFRAWAKWEAKTWASAEFRQFMRSQGVGVEAITHGISRYGEEVFGHGMSSQVANTMFRVSGLNFLDNVRRTATGAMLMDRIGQLARDHETIEAMHPADSAQLKAAGVDAATWQIWRRAAAGGDMVTPNGIRQLDGLTPRQQRDAMQLLIGTISRDVDTVVPMMTDRARARVEYNVGGNRGKIGGELARSVLQFKSFPLAMFSNHWQRLQAQGTPAGKALYAAELFATSSILGALSVQLKTLASGNNPQDMTDAKFAGRAMVQGGALTLPGEILVNAWASPYAETIADQLGPMFSTAEDLKRIFNDTVKNTDGNKANVGGDVVRLIRGNSGNLFYLKAALDHLVFQRLQDYWSPGYSERMSQKRQKDFGAGSWWAPSTAASPGAILSGSGQGITTPQAPDLSTALGGR